MAPKKPAKNLKASPLSGMTFGKEGIYIRIDSSVLKFFRDSGPRWQSRINEVLRDFMEKSG